MSDNKSSSRLVTLFWQFGPTLIFLTIFLSLPQDRLAKNLSFLPGDVLNIILTIHTDLLGIFFSVIGFFGKLIITRLDSVPQTQGSIKVSTPLFGDRVEIIRDDHGAPSLTASTIQDLVFAQGYVHAQDRLWQMEVYRMISKGKLAKTLGAKALEVDKFVRTLGFHRAANEDLLEMMNHEENAKHMAILESYLRGVNEFIHHNAEAKQLGAEFRVLSYVPENFTTHDVFAFSRFMAWQMSKGWDGEVVRDLMIEKVGREYAQELENLYAEDFPVHLPELPSLKVDPIKEEDSNVFVGENGGSNAWVVSGKLTESGKPLLANDPHLQLQNPSTWYYVTMKCSEPDLKLSGWSIPLSPLITLGTNGKIAWGVTLARTDVEDLFHERIRWNEAGSVLYEFKGNMQEAQSFKEVIEVSGQEPFVLDVVETHHGPLIGDIFALRQTIAFSSTTLKAKTNLGGFFQLSFASNYDEFLTAVSNIGSPPLNVLYADHENIGYGLTGVIPKRKVGEGSHIAKGWTGEQEWEGWIPFERLPAQKNPPEGFILSANHKIISEKDEIERGTLLGEAWTTGWRAQRIREMLTVEAPDKFSVAYFKQMQMDTKSLAALSLIQTILKFPAVSESADVDIKFATQFLKEWDGRVEKNSTHAPFYQAVRTFLFRNIFNPSLGPQHTQILMGTGIRLLLKMSNDFHGFDLPMMIRLLEAELERPGSVWWFQQAGGVNHVLTQSLKDALLICRNSYGSDPEGWNWGRTHWTKFTHALGRASPLDTIFNVGPMPAPGDSETVLLSATLPQTGNANTGWAVSFRAIYDFSENCTHWVLPPGQSGHMASPYYQDQVQAWMDGVFWRTAWNEAKPQGEQLVLTN